MRVVLDTNVVVSALLFPNGRLGWMNSAWQSQIICPLISVQTQAEIERVLTYPKFKLMPSMQVSLMLAFLPFAEVVTLPDTLPAVPPCRDLEDEIFMHIAKVADADFLVTGDNDLLALAEMFPIPILNPQAFRAIIEAQANI
jgi:uncharacterized protein